MRLASRQRKGQSYERFMDQWANALVDRKWITSASAMTASEYLQGFGLLPSEYRESFERSTYAVYSYSTPICWFIPDEGWVMPMHKYSQTTTQHQHHVRSVIENWLGEVLTKLG